MDIDLLIEDSRWDAVGLDDIARKSLAKTIEHLGLDTDLVEVSILACDDERIAALNEGFRGKSKATNVLSWPADDLAADQDGAPPLPPVRDPDGRFSLGDIAISFDTCAAEARKQKKKIEHHVAHLLVHGTLHLVGYDHIRDLDATLMETIETKILGKLGIDDPYMT